MSDFWLKVLGSGTSVIEKNRNPAGFWVRAGKLNILMDAGYGVMRRIKEYGYDYQKIDVATVSHFHADHASDIFPLVFARFVDDSYHGRISKNKLRIFGSKDLEKNYKKWRSIFWPSEETYPVEFEEKLGKFNFGLVKIETFEVKHVSYFDSIGVKITYKNRTLVYTGDIGSENNMDDLVKRAMGADLLISEASYHKKTAGHFTFEQIEEVRKRAKIKKVMVVHISPTQVERIRKKCEKNKNLLMAEDGMKIDIK